MKDSIKIVIVKWCGFMFLVFTEIYIMQKFEII